jgi:hypothetical protein
MSDFVIDGTPEQQFAVMRSTLMNHHSVLAGNGKPGLIADVATMRDELIEIKTYGKTSVMLAKVIATILGLGFTAATVYFTTLEYRHRSELIVPRIHSTNHADPAYARNKFPIYADAQRSQP